METGGIYIGGCRHIMLLCGVYPITSAAFIVKSETKKHITRKPLLVSFPLFRFDAMATFSLFFYFTRILNGIIMSCET